MRTSRAIAKRVAKRCGITAMKAEPIVNAVLSEVQSTLNRERRLELRGFGVFTIKRRPQRRAVNPQTKLPMTVPAKDVVSFKPSTKWSPSHAV